MNHNGRNGTNVPRPYTREEKGRIIAEQGGVILPGRDLSFADLVARMHDFPCGVRSQTDDGVWYQVIPSSGNYFPFGSASRKPISAIS